MRTNLITKFYDFNVDGLKGTGGEGDTGQQQQQQGEGQQGAGEGQQQQQQQQQSEGQQGEGQQSGKKDGEGDGEGQQQQQGAGEGEGQQGEGQQQQQQQGEGQQQQQAAPTEAELKAKWLESLGVKDEEELKTKMQQQVVETPEQKQARERQYAVDLDNYAVTNKFIERDDIIRLENLKKMSPEAIAYEKYAAEERAANKDITDEDLRKGFNEIYHVDSENAKLKERGEKAMKRDADEVINSLQGKMNEAKESFDDTNARRSKLPAFKSFVNQQITKHLPETMSLLKTEDGLDVGFQIDPAMRAEVEKFLVNDETFEDFFKNGSTAQTEEAVKKKIEAFVILKNKDKLFSTLASAARAKGLEEGSKVGATAPFGQKKPDAVPIETEAITKEDDAKLGSLMGGR